MRCIVFAPGIMGSVLKDGDNTVWPPTVSELIYDEVYEVSSYGAPFSLGGDSGSLVVTNYDNKTSRIVGIVIAGDKLKSVVLPLRSALKDLKLKLVAGHNV